MQRLNVRPQPGQQMSQAPMGVAGNPQARGMPPVNQQQTALQKLQEEKEQLRKRQEELNRQVKHEVHLYKHISFLWLSYIFTTCGKGVIT